MADRSVAWRIATNFAKARKDADRLADSMERLDRSTKQSDASTTAGAKKAEQATDKRTTAIKEMARQGRIASKVDSGAADAARDAAAAHQEAARATSSRAAATQKVISTAKQAAQTAKQQAAASSDLADADDRVTAAKISQQRATANLERAQRLLAETARKSGTSSDAYAVALGRVKARQLDVEASTHRYNRALTLSARINDQHANSANRNTSAVGRLASAFGRGANSMANFPKAMKGMLPMLGKFAVLAPVVATAVGYLITAVSNLTAGVFSLLGPLSSLGGVLASLPQAASIAAGAIGTIMAAFSGIGDAVKEGVTAQKEMGQGAKDLAKAEKNSARQIKLAQRGVRDAREAAADAARNSAEAIRDSIEAVSDARKAEVDSHRAVGEARKEARRNIEDLRNSLRDLALAERGAALSTEEARRRLQAVMMDPGANDMAKAQAQLAYDEAVARMDDVKSEQERATKEYGKAKKKGVEGSDLVKDALENESDAVEATRDAVRALSDARRDAARSARDSAEAIADAQYNLKEAQQAANEATEAGNLALTKYNEAMAGLSPAGQAFVKQLIGMKDGLKQLKWTAQEALLPGVGGALSTLALKFFPLVQRGLWLFGQTLGQIAQDTANTLTSDDLMPMWGRLLESNNRILKLSGEGLQNIIVALVNLMDAAAPFSEWLTETVVGWTAYWKEISKAGNETGRTADFLDRTKETLKVFGGILKNLWTTFKNIGGAGEELGFDLLRSFRRITKGWAEWTGGIEGQSQLKEWFDSARKPLHEMSKLLGHLTRMFFDLGRKNGDDVAYLISKFDELVPKLETLLSNLQGDFGGKLVDFLGAVIDLLITLTGTGSGGMGAFVNTMTGFVETLDGILQNKAVGGVLQTLLTALGALLALKFIGVLTGLRGLFRLTKNIGGLASKGPGGLFANVFGKNPQKDLNKTANAANSVNRGTGTITTRGSSKKPTASNSRGSQRLARGAGKAASAAAGAGGVISALGVAMSLAGGETGELGQKLTIFGGILWGIEPILRALFGWLGKLLTRFGGWSGVLGKVGSAFKSTFATIGRVVSSAMGFLSKFVGAVAKYMMRFVSIVGRAMMLIGRAMLANPWMLLILALIIVVALVVKYWDQIRAFVMKGINWLGDWISDHWDVIKWFLGPFIPLIEQLVKHWDAIVEAFKHPVKAIEDLLDAFVRGASKTWDQLQDAFSHPVEFFINTVMNDWLIGNVNWVLDKIGLGDSTIPELPEVHGYARGGQVSGYGNRDSVPAVLMPGEFVLRRDAVKSIGVSQLNAMNEGRSFRGQRFATGGPAKERKHFGFGDWVGDAVQGGKDAFGAVQGAAQSTWGAVKNAAGQVVDLAKLGAQKGLELVLKPLRSSLNNLPDVWFLDDIYKQLGNSAMDAAVGWIGGVKAAPEEVAAEGLARGGYSSGVPALLTPGEFVFNAQAAANIGGSALSKMNRSGGSGGRAFRHFAEEPKKFALGGWATAGAGKGKGKKKDKKDKKDDKGDAAASPTATAASILDYLREPEVTEKRYTGKITLEESEKVRKVLKDAYEKKPDRDTLDAFLKANDLYWATSTNSRSGLNLRGAAGGDGLPAPSPSPAPGTGPKSGPKPTPGPIASTIARMWPVRGRETTTYAGHDGVDINYGGGWDDDGDPIVAAAAGRVSYAGTSRGYGDAVFVTGPYGEVVYGHMSRRTVGTGMSVWPGKQIGNVGMTGRASAPHLHFGYPGGTTGGALSFLAGAAPFRIISTPPAGWNPENATVGNTSSTSTSTSSNTSSNTQPPQSNPNGSPGYNPSGNGKPDRERSDYNFSSMLKKGTYRLPGLIKYVGSHSWGDTKKRFDLSGEELIALVEANREKFDRLGAKGKKFMKGYERAKAGREADADAVEEEEAKDNRTPLEIYLDNLSGDIKQQAMWEQALTQFATWGFTDLVSGLLTEGLNDDPENGNFAAAIQAAGLGEAPFNVPNYAAAQQMNELFKQKGAFSTEDLGNLMKMIAFLNTTGGGLRDLARHLGVSDFTVVDLFERALKAGKLNAVPANLMSRLQGDITSYRAGTFYANTGGVVPGTGDGDTVPAMLTPGEFVIRKQAAKALGLNNLLALNSVQKFATGGPVLSPKVSALPTNISDGAAAKALSRVSGGISYTTIYDVDIINPVAEEGTRSMMKMLQRQAALGVGGNTVSD